ncbi:hypothetical protein [Aquimarina sp. 433]
MNQPKLPIDFNEMVTPDLILLSKTDKAIDTLGNTIQLKEGMKIMVYMEDEDEFGNRDDLVAKGTVERNNSDVFPICKWNVRIDQNGIQYQSELRIKIKK